MIQRKQTLFLLLLVFTSIALAIVKCNILDVTGAKIGVSIFVIPADNLQPSIWSYLAAGIDVISLTLAFLTIFLYKNRNLQVRLCYVLMLLQLSLTLIVSFCPMIVIGDTIKYENSGMASIIGVVGMMSAYLAAFYVKRDIELLKSADRIR